MKTTLSFLLFGVPLLAQTPTPPPAGPGDRAPRTNDTDTAPAGMVAFLGLQTAPAGPALASQLRLESGTGVVVLRVEPDTPAAGRLQEHDVLVRFDDQLLVNPEQLGVLVRTRRAGEEVAIRYVRAGETGEVKVTLGERRAPTAGAERFPGPGRAPARIPLPRHEVDRLLSFTEPGLSSRFDFRGGPAPIMRLVKPDHGNFVLSDEQGSVEVWFEAGQQFSRVRGSDGQVQFEGPVHTAEQRAALPGPIRQRLEQLEEMDTLRFRTDGDFVPPARPSL